MRVRVRSRPIAAFRARRLCGALAAGMLSLAAAVATADEVETLRGTALSDGHPPLDVVVIRGTEVGGAVPEPRPAPPPAPAPARPSVQNVTILIAPGSAPQVPVVWGGYGYGIVHRHEHRSIWRPPPRHWKHRPGHHRSGARGSSFHSGGGRVSFSHSGGGRVSFSHR